MNHARTQFAFVGLLLVQCTSAPTPHARPVAAPAADPWPAHAEAILDSMRLTLMAYGERFNAADRDSVLRFYADDPQWSWAVDGRIGQSSTSMIRWRLDRLAAYPRWHLGYRDLHLMPLAPGLVLVSADYQMDFRGASGKALVYAGALTMFWEHRPDGWKVVGGHSSTRLAAKRPARRGA